VRDPRRPANGISQAFSALLACFGRSQDGAIHALTDTRPARGHASIRLNAAVRELRSAAARQQFARSDKSGLSGFLSLKPPPRANLCDRPACLNMPPKSRTAFTQFDRSSPNRSNK
jgi:hypothetical protein